MYENISRVAGQLAAILSLGPEAHRDAKEHAVIRLCCMHKPETLHNIEVELAELWYGQAPGQAKFFHLVDAIQKWLPVSAESDVSPATVLALRELAAQLREPTTEDLERVAKETQCNCAACALERVLAAHGIDMKTEVASTDVLQNILSALGIEAEEVSGESLGLGPAETREEAMEAIQKFRGRLRDPQIQAEFAKRGMMVEPQGNQGVRVGTNVPMDYLQVMQNIREVLQATSHGLH